MSAVDRWKHLRAAESGGARRISRGHALPSSRAVVGGLLISIAAVTLFAAFRNAAAEPITTWLIAEEEIAAGSTIEASDLALAPMDLHPRTEARAFEGADEVIGRIATETLQPGDLILGSDIAAEASLESPARRIGLELDLANALNGDLSVGDDVEVIATETGESGAEVLTVARVTAVSDARDGGVGSSDRVRLTLTVPDATSAQAVVAAQSGGGLTLLGAGTPPPVDAGSVRDGTERGE